MREIAFTSRSFTLSHSGRRSSSDTETAADAVPQPPGREDEGDGEGEAALLKGKLRTADSLTWAPGGRETRGGPLAF
jgi:hypothetical protein